MMFPFESLTLLSREWGLVMAVVLGFGFGFTLERAGFSRATTLAGQFYGHDMRIFKVMFSAVVTAVLGVTLASGFGLIDYRALADAATSATFVWPMMLGGFMVGAGIIIGGYCPGTTLASAGSGNLDGYVFFGGVVLGTFLYSEAYAVVDKFYNSGYLGGLYLIDVLHLPLPVVALLITAMALGCFIGAERIEKSIRRKRGLGNLEFAEKPWFSPARKYAFATFGVAAIVGVLTVAIAKPQTPSKEVASIAAADLAAQVLHEPWKLRVLDIRAQADCAKARIPNSECVPAENLGKISLQDDAGKRTLVLVAGAATAEAPKEALVYQGRVMMLKGGFDAWRQYALTAPRAPAADASAAELKEFQLRSGIYSAMTGVKQAPPPPPAAVSAPGGAKKKGGGGCSG